MKKCVFAGTFDPLTKGHEFVIEKCSQIFDKVVIAIGKNVDKTPLFSLEERKHMIELAFKDSKKVEVAVFDGMLVDFMKENGVSVNVRGIRNEDDYKYELTMERFNRDMFSDVTTIFIPTPQNLVHVSSSAIRNILSLNGDVAEYVPEAINDYIKSVKVK